MLHITYYAPVLCVTHHTLRSCDLCYTSHIALLCSMLHITYYAPVLCVTHHILRSCALCYKQLCSSCRDESCLLGYRDPPLQLWRKPVLGWVSLSTKCPEQTNNCHIVLLGGTCWDEGIASSRVHGLATWIVQYSKGEVLYSLRKKLVFRQKHGGFEASALVMTTVTPNWISKRTSQILQT